MLQRRIAPQRSPGVIREYIRNQEKEDERPYQPGLWR